MAKLNKFYRQRGTTLLELLISVFIVSLVLVPLVSLSGGQTQFLVQLDDRTTADQLVRLVMDSLTRDLHRAGFDAHGRAVTPVISAQTTTLALQHDDDSDGTIDARSREHITYVFRPNTGTLSRIVGRQSMPLARNLPRDGFSLRYLDRTGVDLLGQYPDALGPEERNAIRRVRVRVVVTDDDRVTLAAVETDIAIRNSPWTH